MNWIKQHPIVSTIIVLVLLALIRLISSVGRSVQKDITLVDQINSDIVPQIAQLEIQLDEFGRSAEAENFGETLRRLDNISSNMATIRNSIPHYQWDDINLSQWLVSLDQAITILENTSPQMKDIIIKAQNKTITSKDEVQLDEIIAQRENAGELFDEAGTAFEAYSNQ
jgi:hypothetical protein